eukprot:g32804.t1
MIGTQMGSAHMERLAGTLVGVALMDGDAEVRQAAVQAIVTFNDDVKREAARRIAEEGLRYELESLHCSRRNVKSAACAAIGWLGPEFGLPYLEILQDCLKDKSSLVKKRAMAALSAWGPPVASQEFWLKLDLAGNMSAAQLVRKFSANSDSLALTAFSKGKSRKSEKCSGPTNQTSGTLQFLRVPAVLAVAAWLAPIPLGMGCGVLLRLVHFGGALPALLAALLFRSFQRRALLG